MLVNMIAESVLDETIQRIDAKTLLLKEREKLLEDMENKITYLRSVQSSLKDESLLADERLKALQEEVHLLWDVSRKNNFELHVLELKAQDAEERLEAVTSKVEKQNQLNDDNRNLLIRELDDAKLNLSQSVLDGTIQRIDAKTLLLKEREKLLEDMENNITYLRSVQSSLKDESLLADERLKALQEEVHLLWDVSRKNNFELHVLELKAQDAEERLEAVTSKVEKIRALQYQRQRCMRCTFLKHYEQLYRRQLLLIKSNDIPPDAYLSLEHYSFGLGSTMNYYMSQAFPQSRRFYSATKKYHHELQGFIKQEMRRNEFTATFANDELVFFLASALITFPVLSAWMALSSRLN
ncbi:tropomyosin-like isoform X2 [Hibiscus syriacus]|uniref:Tropomyosin-like isoform X2 n=1 Tax=Hibiscus syriacus TaxID=106335 RepID=A0A6A3CZF1_HIBSY|nr:tropomyosin-like isoform X2 [Hibiscus syriacus]